MPWELPKGLYCGGTQVLCHCIPQQQGLNQESTVPSVCSRIIVHQHALIDMLKLFVGTIIQRRDLDSVDYRPSMMWFGAPCISFSNWHRIGTLLLRGSDAVPHTQKPCGVLHYAKISIQSCSEQRVEICQNSRFNSWTPSTSSCSNGFANS